HSDTRPVCVKCAADTVTHVTRGCPRSPIDRTATTQTLSPTHQQTLRRSSQYALIISHKFLDTLGCEFMCDVKALPWKVQIQLFVRDRLQKLATRIDRFIPEILIRHWKACCRPLV